MTEAEQRAAIVKEALTWVGTPFVYGACVKKVGVDCGRFLAATLTAAGVVDIDVAKLPMLPPMWFLHCSAEQYPPIIATYSKEYQLAPNQVPQPGDIVLAKYGRDYAHSVFVLAWPKVIGSACESCVTIWRDIHASPQFASRPLRYFNPIPVQAAK